MGNTVGTYDIVPSGLASSNYDISFANGTLTVIAKDIPAITWANPAAITYGTALSATQLNATASVAGSFSYSPPLGTVLSAGDAQTLEVTFTPDDSLNYAGNTDSVALDVTPAPLTVTANDLDPAGGASTPAFTVGYTGFVNGDDETALGGTLAFAPVPTTLGSYDIVPSGLTSSNYDISFANGTLTVIAKDIPAISWADPAAITYGTALSDTELNATASFNGLTVAGTFSYNPPLGTVLSAGDAQTLAVTFTPDDSLNYAGNTDSVALDVTPAPLAVTANDLTRRVGRAPRPLPSATPALSTARMPAALGGTLAFAPVPTTLGSYDIVPSGLTSSNYDISFIKGALTVTAKDIPAISWANPAAITYGAALSATQLNATASVAGSFSYSPALGTVLSAGNAQTLEVTFTPNDSLNYAEETSTVTLDVTPAPLTVTANDLTRRVGASTPAFTVGYTGFVNGEDETALGGSLSFASVPTTLGTYPIVPSGLASSNYDISFVNGTLTVIAKDIPAITWANPAAITYGTALSATQLNATTSVAGSFSYNPPLGTVLSAGNGQTLEVTFTPNDGANYVGNTATVSLNVTPAPLTVTANDLTRRVGVSTPAFTVSYTGFVNGENASVLGGTLAFAPVADTVGTYAIVPSGLTSSNYNITFADGILTVTTKDIPVITWANPAAITYGTALSAAQLNATASVAGSFSYNPPLGTVLSAGSGLILEVTFTPSDGASYATTSHQAQITVTKASLTATADAKSRAYGAANPSLSYTVSGLVNGNTAAATLAGSLATTATAASPVGTYAISQGSLALTTAGANNYTLAFTAGTLTVNKALLTVKVNNATRRVGEANPAFSVTYSGFVNGQGAAALGGTLAFKTTATAASPVGTYDIVPSGLTSGNYTISFVKGTLNVLATGQTPSYTVYLPLIRR